MYYQPPFYRELRDQNGVVQPNVKAQSSFHIVLSNDFSFKMWERPFKMVTEAYYKSMTDVNPIHWKTSGSVMRPTTQQKLLPKDSISGSTESL
jgi:hypothetical protein